MVTPVMAGLDEQELGLEALLKRAANAGARFAGMSLLSFGPGQRENFLQQVTQAYPEQATRFRRVIGRRPHTEQEKAAVERRFEDLCSKLGLVPINTALSPRRVEPSEPAQLALFDAGAVR